LTNDAAPATKLLVAKYCEQESIVTAAIAYIKITEFQNRTLAGVKQVHRLGHPDYLTERDALMDRWHAALKDGLARKYPGTKITTVWYTARSDSYKSDRILAEDTDGEDISNCLANKTVTYREQLQYEINEIWESWLVTK